VAKQIKKRKSGIPTGNAGEYFVMGELLRRGFDAQLADRNTKGYDIVVGGADGLSMRRVQVKTVRGKRSDLSDKNADWYVNGTHFKGERRDQVTVYVLLGPENGARSARFFIAKNREVAKHVHHPPDWTNGFMSLKAIEKYEDHWDSLR